MRYLLFCLQYSPLKVGGDQFTAAKDKKALDVFWGLQTHCVKLMFYMCKNTKLIYNLE